MKMSPQGVVELCASEGIVIKRYLDSVNVWTIGVGHTRNAGEPNPENYKKEMPVEECMDLLMRDLVKYENGVNAVIGDREVSQHAFDGMVHFHYNTGGIRKASFVPYLLDGNMEEAEKRILFWKKPASILTRRKREVALMINGVYSSDGIVPVYKTNNKNKPVYSHNFDAKGWVESKMPVEPKEPPDLPVEKPNELVEELEIFEEAALEDEMPPVQEPEINSKWYLAFYAGGAIAVIIAYIMFLA